MRPVVAVADADVRVGEAVARLLFRGGFDAVAVSPTLWDVRRHAAARAVGVWVLGFDEHPWIDVSALRSAVTSRGRQPRIVVLHRPQARLLVEEEFDDFLAKPFSARVLVTRVTAVLDGRGEVSGPGLGARGELRVGDLMIDPAARRVTRGDEQIALAQREFDLLANLARHRGVTRSREQLMRDVWGLGSYSDTQTVTVHIRRLRRKLEPDPANPQYIHTVWGEGYRFRQ